MLGQESRDMIKMTHQRKTFHIPLLVWAKDDKGIKGAIEE